MTRLDAPIARRAVDLFVGLAAALLVFAAVPVVLVVAVGSPLPSHLSSATVLSLHGLFDALTVVSWCAWACCAWPILRAVARRVRQRDVSGGAAVVDRVAMRIAAGVLALTALVGTAALGAGTAGAATRPTVRTSASVPRVRGERLAWREATPPPAGGASSAPDLPVASAAAVGSSGPSAPGWPPNAPQLAALGTGALVAALLARRLGRARRRYAFARVVGDRLSEPNGPEADAGALVAPFERLATLHWVEVACRHLHLALSAGDAAPPLAWLRAGPDGVEARFAAPLDATLARGPAPWTRVTDESWLLPKTADLAALDRKTAGVPPRCPALVALGDDARGTWLVPLGAGAHLMVVGPAADDLVRAARAGVERWSWSEQLCVTDDAGRATELARRLGKPSEPHAPSLVFFGDPSALPDDVRQCAAVVSTGPASTGDRWPDAAVTVVVDARAATVHPFGLSLRPHLLRAETLAVLEDTERRYEAGADHGASDRARPGSGSGPDTLALRAPHSGGATVRVPLPAAPADAATLGTEVRLLQSVPDVAGLAAPFDPKRARRAVELVAYLALHHPEPVTSDRLRTRVLGSPDADAASKTLFNTATAARNALGRAPGGELLLPAATRAGHYRISSAVTVDVRRCVESIDAALAALAGEVDEEESEDPLALLESALGLVRAEPLGGVLTGFAWWRAEGHERRLADAVVDGTCALVRRSIADGSIERGRWALERARLVEPYSEALTRAGLRLAAASGDPGRLQREWQACLRQADEIDPGALPSADTERLFVTLRAELAARGREAPHAALGV